MYKVTVQVCSYNKGTSAGCCIHITQLTMMHDVMYGMMSDSLSFQWFTTVLPLQ